MVSFVKGDMLATPVTMIAHGVNLTGAFAAGIAGAIAFKHPWAKADYATWLTSWPKPVLGDIRVSVPPFDDCSVGRPPQPPCIAHLATQQFPGPCARLGAVELSLRLLAAYPQACARIAIPRIGCGIGGLRWEDVRPLIVEIFRSHPGQVLVFEEYVRGQAAT